MGKELSLAEGVVAEWGIKKEEWLRLSEELVMGNLVSPSSLLVESSEKTDCSTTTGGTKSQIPLNNFDAARVSNKFAIREKFMAEDCILLDVSNSLL